jgi:hypothetical protein
MKFAVPRYEVRYLGKEIWEDISEFHLMQRLSETYDQVCPVIQKMLEGKQVLSPEAVYRLKRQDDVKFL